MNTKSKALPLIIYSVFCVLPLLSQTAISSSGSNYSTPHTHLSWTLGEAVISTITSPNVHLTQGFHQGGQIILSVPSVYPLFQIKTYPNPTSGRFNISLSNNSNPWVTRIYDLSGKLLFHQSYSGIQFKTTLDISSYADGIYLINISTKQQIQQVQILKTQ